MVEASLLIKVLLTSGPQSYLNRNVGQIFLAHNREEMKEIAALEVQSNYLLWSIESADFRVGFNLILKTQWVVLEPTDKNCGIKPDD